MSTLAAPDVTNNPSTREFEQIFRQYSRLVYRTAYGVTGNAEDAEDVLQTIFLRLVRREPPPNLRNNPHAYLYRAAVNVSLSIIRSRRECASMPDLETFESSVHSARERHSQEVREHLLAMLDTMAQANPEDVELLILRYVHNYSDADIAKMLGKSRSAIAVRLFRARARLKKLMRRSGDRR
jgi:RNA polymerase sigma-70 factor, ECF subfamily